MRRSTSSLSTHNNPRSSAKTCGKFAFTAYQLFSPRLRVSAVSGLVWLVWSVCAAAQTPAPQLSADLSHSPGWVVISVDDYQTLRAHAFPADRPPDPPPVDAPLTRLA